MTTPPVEHAELPVVEAPAVVVAPPAVSQPPTTTREQELDAQSLRTISERSAPRTTEEEDRGTAGQRNINVMWEGTQRVIAIGFAYGSILICAYIIVWGPMELKLAALTYILTMGATVNQSYFTRTNHTKVGGVGGERAGSR